MENNPLRQFFRRPSIYTTLPSKGRFYTPDVFEPTANGEIPIFPMTAIDEITSKTPDAVFSGQAVVDIIQSCVPNVKDAWRLNIIDIEALIIAIRIASNGENLDITSTCPSCQNEANYDVDLMDLLTTQRDVNYEETLKIRELEVQFKPLVFREVNENNLAQYELQKLVLMLQSENSEENQKAIGETVTKLNQVLATMVSTTIDNIRTPESVVTERGFISEFLQNCDRNTSQAIKDHSLKLKTQNDLKPMRLKCTSCNHEYDQELVLNITNFFD